MNEQLAGPFNAVNTTSIYLINKTSIDYGASVPSIKVCLTSTMESTSFLPYQSGSYMSAKHACTFLDDSCIADDNNT